MIIQVTRAGVILSVVKAGPSIQIKHIGTQGIPGVGVPTGGSAGQVLSKASGTNYDTEWVNQSGGGGGGVTDHGDLTGLADDDHSQYHNDTRGDARYYTKSQSDTNYEAKNANIQSHISSTANPHGVTKSQVGLGSADNTSDIDKPISSAQQAAINLKADINSPTFTGTVSGITKSMVGLSNVDNTSDASKPVSTNQQAALDLKANINSPTFTGTVSGITKSMVGLTNVDNTSDVNKPVSTAQQTAIDAKVANNLTASTTIAPSKSAVNTGLGLKVDKAGDTLTGALVFNGSNGLEFAGVKVNNTSLTGYSTVTARADDGEVIQIGALNSGGALNAFGIWLANQFGLYAKRTLNILTAEAGAEIKFASGDGQTLSGKFDSAGRFHANGINLISGTVENVPAPTASGHAANKNYVDTESFINALIFG